MVVNIDQDGIISLTNNDIKAIIKENKNLGVAIK